MRLIALTLTLGLLVAACGGGNTGDPNHVLQIGGADKTESEWRTSLRAGALLDGQARLCRSFDGLSDTEASDLLAALLEQESANILARALLTVAQVDTLLDLADHQATGDVERMVLLDEAKALVGEAETLRDEAMGLMDQNVADTNRLAAIVQEECRRLG